MKTGFKYGAACFLLSMGVYLNSLWGGFVNWDDAWLIESNPYLGSASLDAVRAIINPFGDRDALGAEYLPVRDLSWLGDSLVWGKRPLGYHLGNAVLHGCNGVLVFDLALVLGAAGPEAFAAAALFAVHPAHTEAVAWATGRKDVLSAFFFLVSLLAFLRAASRRGWWLAFGAFVLSVLSKYPSVVLPLVLLSFEASFRWNERRNLPKKLAPFFAAAAGLVLLAVAVATSHKTSVLPEQAVFQSTGQAAAGYVHAFLKYLGLTFLPFRLSAIHDVPAGLGWPAVCAMYAAAFVSIGLFALGAAMSRWLLFVILFYLVTLLPFLGLFPIKVYMAERFLYLPSIAACLFLPRALFALERRMPDRWVRLRVVPALLSAVCLVWAVQTVLRNPVWGDDGKFWRDTVEKAPRNPTAHLGYSEHLREVGDVSAALRELEKGCSLGGENPALSAECERRRRIILGKGEVERIQ